MATILAGQRDIYVEGWRGRKGGRRRRRDSPEIRVAADASQTKLTTPLKVRRQNRVHGARDTVFYWYGSCARGRLEALETLQYG